MTTCYLDAFSGLSGDMLVGALVDAGADAGTLREWLDSLGTGATFEWEPVKRRGIGATKFRVSGGETKAHRHLSHIFKMIDGSASIPVSVKSRAKQVFQRLGEAEAAVHRVPIEKVHFHEVGAVDSIADIVGACAGFELLGVDEIVCSPVNVGSGTVNTEHGVLPVPAPATARLLEGVPVYSRGPALELTTPTGAAVVTALATRFGAMPSLRIRATGYGAGDRDFAEHANVLRVMLGEPTGALEATTVAVLEANIDDMSPEVLAYATEQLLGKGALDATLTPMVMKKGRPGLLLRVVARPEDREQLAEVIFAETSTLGLRTYAAERRVQPRDWAEVDTSAGTVRVKTSPEGGCAPEFEDCRKLAIQTGRPLRQIYAEASHAYLSTKR
jgi:pyridinium-3,5-bisthiocarboxylic acid mononucleotide nickel chelatase